MNHDPDTDTGLTEAETAAIADGNAEDAARVAAAAAPVVAEPAAVVVPSPADEASARMLEAANRIASAADSLAARAAEPVAAAPVAEVPVTRDYDAEIAALEQRFDDGEIEDQAEYRRLERAILRDQGREDAAAEIRQAEERQRLEAQQRSQADADAAWSSANAAFFADPGNAAMVADPIKAAGFKAAVDVVFAEAKGEISFDALLVKARERLTGVPAIDPGKAQRDAMFNREQASGNQALNTLRDTPSAGNNDQAPGASLDNLGISDLEDTLAKMSDADRNRYLASAPGGYGDNPRLVN